jgi:predicted ATPase
LSIVNVVRAEYARASEHGQQCLSLAERFHNQTMFMQAHWLLGLSQCYLGAFAVAREHFDETIAIHDAEGIDSAFSMYGAVLSRAHLARMLLYLGYPDQSRRIMDHAIAKAERLRHPVGVANTLGLAAFIDAFHRRRLETLELAARTARQAEDHGLPYYTAVAMMMRGWVLAMQNQEAEGIALIRQGLASYLAIGTRQQHGYFLALLAEALNKAGRVEEGLDALIEGIDVAKRNNEPFYEAELYRLKGDALASAGVVSYTEAESCFQRAIEIAHQQQAKSFELRAVMSLARLWQHHGKRDEGRAILSEIYGWFTEGFATADLADAKVLLDELSI